MISDEPCHPSEAAGGAMKEIANLVREDWELSCKAHLVKDNLCPG